MEKIGQYASRAGFEGYASIPFQMLGGCVMSRSGERSVRIREVKGSNPSRSTIKKSREIADFTAFLFVLLHLRISPESHGILRYCAADF